MLFNALVKYPIWIIYAQATDQCLFMFFYYPLPKFPKNSGWEYFHGWSTAVNRLRKWPYLSFTQLGRANTWCCGILFLSMCVCVCVCVSVCVRVCVVVVVVVGRWVGVWWVFGVCVFVCIFVFLYFSVVCQCEDTYCVIGSLSKSATIWHRRGMHQEHTGKTHPWFVRGWTCQGLDEEFWCKSNPFVSRSCVPLDAEQYVTLILSTPHAV